MEFQAKCGGLALDSLWLGTRTATEAVFAAETAGRP